MGSDPTIVRLLPSDVDGYHPTEAAVERVHATSGDVTIIIGPDVPFFSGTASLVLRLIDIVRERGNEVTVESGPLKVAVLRVLGFASIARLRENPEDTSWLFGR